MTDSVSARFWISQVVTFRLRDDSAERVEALVEDARRSLSGHPGTRFFAVGTRSAHLNGPANVRDFDVSLHVVFEDSDAHERYQGSEAHLAFIARNRSNWAEVRILNSNVGP